MLHKLLKAVEVFSEIFQVLSQRAPRAVDIGKSYLRTEHFMKKLILPLKLTMSYILYICVLIIFLDQFCATLDVWKYF